MNENKLFWKIMESCVMMKCVLAAVRETAVIFYLWYGFCDASPEEKTKS